MIRYLVERREVKAGDTILVEWGTQWTKFVDRWDEDAIGSQDWVVVEIRTSGDDL